MSTHERNFPIVYIIVLNWNRSDDTIACLDSLSHLNIKDFKLFVTLVDNGSTNDCIESIKRFKTGKYNINIIENQSNLGFAEGNNVGIEYALKNNADYVFILNNDTLVDKDIINKLLKAADRYKDAGIFTPKIYFAKGFEFHKKYKKNELGKVIWSAGGQIDWNNVYGENAGVDEVDNGQFGKNRETDFATGAAMFVRSEVFKKYGLFDERYFMYFEDVDLCFRYKRSGGKIIYVGSAILWHKVAQSSGIGSDLNDYYITRNRLLFGMGYAPLRTKLALYKESVKFLMYGRPMQKKGVLDFYTAKFGRGTIENKL